MEEKLGDRGGKDYHFTVIIEKEEGGFHVSCSQDVTLKGRHLKKQ